MYIIPFESSINKGEFMPHMTIGEFANRTDLNNDYEDVFSVLVDKISVEIIDDNEDPIIEIDVNLSKK
ncbi:hypothetical protein [Clostridium lacusfryxellense]|uniref:hypothetical protein n=1 Tax=Clostridium lacusfryxellense TaxID=205328 RepID=UPI001C0D5EE8|nr:hypothetical protein [Clostridium lacusfryxellense]MBU3113075.1 hypothetical protein [Clostridium lacusfryxellense]